MQNLMWEFASTGGGREDGISNPLIEHFKGNTNYHLAREIIQNSLDARLDDKVPVTVTFGVEQFSKDRFPGKDQFENILEQAMDYWKDDSKAIRFLSDALVVLRSESISVMKVSDYNTTGLWGDDENKKAPWYNLVKSRGASSKLAGEGGYFGIGKGAPFASSELRTVFYSTKSQKDSKSRFIGIAEIVSFRDGEDIKSGNGSYGYPKQKTVMDPVKMPDDGFWRREFGLDLYITGYNTKNNWKDSLILSVLRNFWYAIYNGDLLVSVDDVELTSSNLETYLNKYFLSEPFRDYIEPIGNPHSYYQAVNKGKVFEETLPHLGDVKLYFKPIEEPLNHIAMIRGSHMIIYSKRFQFPAPFAGVFVCDDPKGNEELRLMEPPAHDKWDPDRNEENGDVIMEELINWIRKCLREQKEVRKSEILEIPDLYKYLPFEEDIDDEGSGGRSYTDKEGEEETSKLIQRNEVFKQSVKVEPYSVSVINKPASGLGGMGIVLRDGKRKTRKGPKAPGVGEGINRALKPDELRVRTYCTSRRGHEQEYTAIFRSEISGKCDIKVWAIGESSSDKIRILDVVDKRGYNYHISNNCIHKFNLEKEKEIIIEIKLESRIRCSLNIVGYEL